MFDNESFTTQSTSTSANNMADRSANHFNSGKREIAKNSLRDASAKFDVVEEHADQAPQNPMRQLSHSLRTCLTERTDSEISLGFTSMLSLMASTRFAESDRSLLAAGQRHDQPMHRPMRELSKSTLSMGSTRFSGSDRSLFTYENLSSSSPGVNIDN
ncbi:unnamed protein product [Cylindrotheca closterium]|uniref:Uncharacterized protein n=1 Tax=Cylindrotheca closterium TaxID=2856 RepID=A0AAD2GAU9_9STRA|nr:unnamed protein product [Cylindrotheca closterium]